MITVAIAATVTLAFSLRLWPIEASLGGAYGVLLGLAFWIAITLLASAAPVHVPRGAYVSVSVAPVLAAALLGGPSAGAVVAVVGTLEVREFRRQVPWWGVVYNHTFVVFPAVAAGVVMAALGRDIGLPTTVLGVVLGGVAYFVIAEGLTSLAVAMVDGRSFKAVAATNVRSYGLTMIGLTPIAWLMALAYTFVGPLVAPVFALPLYTTRAAYKAVVDVRNMFTQTVRALASAIDARDPSTRRHSDHVSDDRGRDRPGHAPVAKRSSSSSSGPACSMTSARSASATPSS